MARKSKNTDKNTPDNVVPFEQEKKVEGASTESAQPTPTLNLKPDDWAYFAFELVQIGKINETGNVVEIKTSAGKTISATEKGNFDSGIIPQSLTAKAASDYFLAYTNTLLNLSRMARLNINGIYPTLLQRWKELATALANSDAEKEKTIKEELEKLVVEIEKVIAQLHSIKVGDIQLFS